MQDVAKHGCKSMIEKSGDEASAGMFTCKVRLHLRDMGTELVMKIEELEVKLKEEQIKLFQLQVRLNSACSAKHERHADSKVPCKCACM